MSSPVYITVTPETQDRFYALQEKLGVGSDALVNLALAALEQDGSEKARHAA